MIYYTKKDKARYHSNKRESIKNDDEETEFD